MSGPFVFGTWYPIEDLPDEFKNGRLLDLWFAQNAPDGGSIENGERWPDCQYYDERYWLSDSHNLMQAIYVTHFMLPPEPPS